MSVLDPRPEVLFCCTICLIRPYEAAKAEIRSTSSDLIAKSCVLPSEIKMMSRTCDAASSCAVGAIAMRYFVDLISDVKIDKVSIWHLPRCSLS